MAQRDKVGKEAEARARDDEGGRRDEHESAGYDESGRSETWYTEAELNEMQRRKGQPQGEAGERERIGPGMEVVGSDGKLVGRVKEAGTNTFLVDRPLARDVYVPYEACRSVEPGRVWLQYPATDVDQMGWGKP
jgi:hypothetical protein